MSPETMASALMLCWLALGPTAAAQEVVDEVLSVVGNQVVTLSDVQFERVLAAHDRSPLPMFDGPDADLQARLEDLRILRELAGDVDVFQPDAQDVDARLAAFKLSWTRRADYEQFLRRWGVDEAGLRGQLYARMVVERYVERNLGLSSRSDASDPAQQTAIYEAWMNERRVEQTLRRVPPRP